MKNNQLLPFERNRYYKGKMLTSSDFQAEQAYSNNKRRFVNQIMYGSGIVCGCGVTSLDDLSILVESGAAIDDYGREIVISSSVVKKLSAIEGFEQLQSNDVMLCLRYQEQEVHSVYSVNYQETGKEYEFNRISEGYEIFLTDSESVIGVRQMAEDEFLVRNCLYSDEDYEIELTVPAVVCKGIYTKIEVTVRKLSDSTEPVTFQGVLQMPVLTTLNGEHELELSLKNVNLAIHESITKEFWVKAQEMEAAGSELIMKTGTVTIYRNEKEMAGKPVAPVKISIESNTPEKLVAGEIGKISLEMRNIGNRRDYLCIAHLKLVRTDSAYLIESIREKEIKKYIAAPVQYPVRTEYLSYFAKEKQIPYTQEKEQKPPKEIPAGSSGRGFATGVLEIPLGEQVRKGDIRYSGEIMHGLGKGNVYVDIGYEYYAEDTALGANTRSTVYGAPKLFPKDGIGAADTETAVKVLNDKGSFVAAVRLLKEVDFLVLTYRWVAVKFTEEEKEKRESYTDKSIMAVTPTVVLGTKESYFFDVQFHNMERCSIAYELTEQGSGEVTMEGVYTAPNKEGVYEIRIYCTDIPVICTYAYAIVKKEEPEA